MKPVFSTKWKASAQPRKQRKYLYNAPLHTRGKFLAGHLSKDLRKKYGKRSISLKKGDKVKIMRGAFKGQTGKIDRVDRNQGKIYVTGIEATKPDGTKVAKALQPSNLLITDLETGDKKRFHTPLSPDRSGKQENKQKIPSRGGK